MTWLTGFVVVLAVVILVRLRRPGDERLRALASMLAAAGFVVMAVTARSGDVLNVAFVTVCIAGAAWLSWDAIRVLRAGPGGL